MKTIKEAFLEYLQTRFDSMTPSDRVDIYILAIAQRWAIDFGKSDELAAVAKGMPLAKLAAELVQLEPVARVWLAQALAK